MARAYSYIVTIKPEKLAVPIETFKLHLKRRGSSEDALLNLYLQAAINYAEKITRRCLIDRTIRTYRDFFPGGYSSEGYYPCNSAIEIRKSKLQSVVEINYLSEGILTLIDPSVYYVTNEEDYSEILPVGSWPMDVDRRMQSIIIDVVCGFGPAPKDVPKEYQIAIMEHATSIRANRGDCSDSSCASAVPASAKTFYLQERIENL